jgi:hypothetical protein
MSMIVTPKSRAVADRIVAAAREPESCTDLANAAGISAQAAHLYIKTLVKNGELLEVGSRYDRGILRKLYCKHRHVDVEPAVKPEKKEKAAPRAKVAKGGGPARDPLLAAFFGGGR